MPVSPRDVEQIAALARLSLSAAEREAMTGQLNEILRYMEQLNTLDTDAVEPLAHVLELVNVFREDAARPGVPREEALRNAPASTGEFFMVPKVITDR